MHNKLLREQDQPDELPHDVITLVPSTTFDNTGLIGDISAPNANNLFPVDNIMPDSFSFPDFFEQIMMSDGTDIVLQNNLVMPPDVSNFTRDYNNGSSDSDFSFLLPQTPIPAALPTTIEITASNGDTGQLIDDAVASQTNAQRRHEALTKSPWSWDHWIPPQHFHAFTGQDVIAIDENGVRAKDQLTPNAANNRYHCELNQRDRDRMMNVVGVASHIRHFPVPTFPTLVFLNDLIDIYLSQETNAISAIIHTPSMRTETTRPELLLAMCAAGASFVAHEPTWRLGLFVQETVRVAISEAIEQDNSLTRELQTEQAWMLWLQVGVWSGFRRKTEIASCTLQPLYAMFSWSYSFTRHKYRDITPSVQDDSRTLEEKWRRWAEQEGRKRLAIYLFLHDAQVAFIQLRNPLLSCGEMQLPVPTERELWLAPNARSWRERYLSKQRPTQAELPCMADVFADLSVLDGFESIVDTQLCGLVACYALAHEVSDFRKQSKLFKHRMKPDQRDRSYSHMNWQRDLLEDIQSRKTYCEIHFPGSLEMTLAVECLTMFLHVALDDIQSFSGKAGEEEARKAYPLVRDWTNASESRVCVWHAGQVLRIARMFNKTKLRDFYAVAVYHAALILYVYGMVTSKTRRSGMQATAKTDQVVAYSASTLPIASAQPVFLDTTDEKPAQAFILLGHGLPGLKSRAAPSGTAIGRTSSSPTAFCALQNARGVMTIAADVLESNFPHHTGELPPLVDNLTKLIRELGNLSP